MEDGHRPLRAIKQMQKMSGLNPYCNGRWSQTYRKNKKR